MNFDTQSQSSRASDAATIRVKRNTVIDFKHKQLYFQSKGQPAIESSKNDKAFNTNINLKQVTRTEGFGKVTPQQIERQIGNKKKLYQHSRISEAQAVLQYDNAPSFRPEKISDKINSFKTAQKPEQEFIARTLTYCKAYL